VERRFCCLTVQLIRRPASPHRWCGTPSRDYVSEDSTLVLPAEYVDVVIDLTAG
jgi:hypothetical protein